MMALSANCPVVHFASPEPVGPVELPDLLLHLALKRLKPSKLFHLRGHLPEVACDERAQRYTALRSRGQRLAVHVIGNSDRNVLHASTLTQDL
jgi:hypothetical protein